MIKFIKTPIPIERSMAIKLEQNVNEALITQIEQNIKKGIKNEQINIVHTLCLLNVINYLKNGSYNLEVDMNDLAKMFTAGVTGSGDSFWYLNEIESVVAEKEIGILIFTNEYVINHISLIKINEQSKDSILRNLINKIDEDDVIEGNKFNFNGIRGIEAILNDEDHRKLRDQLYKEHVTDYNSEHYLDELWDISYRITVGNGMTKQDLIGNDDINGDELLDMLQENKNGALYYDGEINNNDDFNGNLFNPENHEELDMIEEISEHVTEWNGDYEPILETFLATNGFSVKILDKTFGGKKEDLRK